MLLLATLGFVAQMMLRITFNVVLVAMVNFTAIPHAEVGAAVECTNKTSEEDHEEGEFAWNENTQGWLLAAFYIGYLFLQVPGGVTAERFGSKRVLGLSQGVNGMLALLLPVAATKGGHIAVGVVRFLQGLACGPVYPCLFPLVARWFPPGERQKAFGLVNAVTAVGIWGTSAAAGWLAKDFGWRWVFYVGGGLTVTWSIFWFALVHNTPEEDPAVSDQERRKIGTGNVTVARTRQWPPFRVFLCSPPVLAIIAAEMANSWSFTIFSTSLPTYMKKVLGLDLKKNALYSGLPMVCRAITMLTAGAMADCALKRHWLSVKVIRRGATGLCIGGGALMMGLLLEARCNVTPALVLFCGAGMFNGFIATGAMLNSMDIAPNYSGSVYSIANTLGCVCSILSPVVTGKIVDGNQTFDRWRIVFIIGCVVLCVSLVLYQAMMSTTRQPWDRREDDDRGDKQDVDQPDQGPAGEQRRDSGDGGTVRFLARTQTVELPNTK